MKTKASLFSLFSIWLLMFTPVAVADDSSTSLQLRQAVPVDAHIAVYGRHNPERDYQQAYLADIWQTVQDERLLERFVEIVTSRIPEDDLAGAKSVCEEIRTALEPIDWQSLAQCHEMVYSQQMEVPFNHHLVLLRLSEEDATACETAFRNVLAMFERHCEGNVSVCIDRQGDVEITSLGLPKKVPFSPALARVGDVLLFSTSKPILRQSLTMLREGGGKSKFDDPRLVEALAKLPEAEDSLVFVDGRLLFEKLGGLGDFIRKENNGNAEAARVSRLIDLLMDEMAVLDYEVTVEYTEGYQNCSAAIGKLLPDAENTLLGKAVAGGQPFEHWQSWVPADAVAYSLSTGASLHAVYERLVEIARQEIPETNEAFEQFEQVQEQLGVHLDRDILQSFSGESVSISLPSESPAVMGGQDSVMALRCQNPERIKELLHRLIDVLTQNPAIQAQQLQLVKSDQLDGFEELRCMLFGMFGVQPVIGFQDGWMIVGTNAKAVQKVLDARAGKTTSIDTTAAFQQFQLEIRGPVCSLSYTNLAESTRHTAQLIRQVGTITPVVLGILGAQGNLEEMQPVQELLGLLPSVAKIVEKFDYLQAKLAVTQQGDSPDSYVTRSVTLVRPPSEDKPASPDNEVVPATAEQPALSD